MNTGNQVLLVRHAYGNGAEWSLPGGSVRMHESPVDGVVREIYEETGIKTKPQGLINFCAPERWAGSFALTFCCIPNTKDLIPRVHAFEIQKAEWFPLDSLPTTMTEFSELRVEEYRHGKTGHISTIPNSYPFGPNEMSA
ncbi:MAG: NUDIX hydrolase [Deltaproteobacteria bacterium]|nr:NUDIX hydrolase [Deltaproteobacteria bacterium]